MPPKDVGGVYGYEEFLVAIRDPSHPEHEGDLMWAGEKFDPEALNREQVDQALKKLERSEMARVYQRHCSAELGPERKTYQAVSVGLESLDDDQRAQLSELPLRQDAVTSLTYVRENRISETRATGNFPLRPAGKLPPVSSSRSFGRKDWRLGSQNPQCRGCLASRFPAGALSNWRFDNGWAAPDMSHAHRFRSNAIERMVINILEDFGGLKRVSADEWIGRHRISHLQSFSLTGLGKGLLKALAGGSF